MMPCWHSHNTMSVLLWPARLSHTSSRRSEGNGSGKVKGAVSPSCHTCHAARVAAASAGSLGIGSLARIAVSSGLSQPCRTGLVQEVTGCRDTVLWRDGTGSGSWSCRHGHIRAAAWRAGRVVANCCPSAAQPGMGRPRPRTTPADQGQRLAYRPARSAPFYHCIRIGDADQAAFLTLAHNHASLAPGPALLPTETSSMQGAADRVGADAGQAIGRLAQRRSQRAQRPTRRTITRAVRRAGNLGEDTALFDLAIANRMAAAMARHHCGQPSIVETRDPTRHGVAGAAADKGRGRRVIQPFGHSQQGPGTCNLRCRCAGRPAQPNQRDPLRILQRTERLLLLSGHQPPPHRSTTIMAYSKPSDPVETFKRDKVGALPEGWNDAARLDPASTAPDPSAVV